MSTTPDIVPLDAREIDTYQPRIFARYQIWNLDPETGDWKDVPAIQIYAREDIDTDHIIDTICHELLHYVIDEEVSYRTTEALDNIAGRGKYLHRGECEFDRNH